MIKVVFVIGPTAVGKTELALHLAEAFGSEIVGADSRQVYRGLDIGTAKPTLAQRTRILHHLVDVAEPDEAFTLAQYLRLARAAISDIAGRGRVSFVVGGTGQYLWALLRGHRPPAVAPDPELRERLERLAATEGSQALFAELARLAPGLAARTDPRNPRRLTRAIEVAMAVGSGQVAGVEGESSTQYDALVLGLTLPRAQLYVRADARIEAMIEAGWLEEARDLIARYGDARRLPAFAALGYHQLVAHLAGEASFAASVQRAKFDTHRFIRQQYAWFRRPDFGTRWWDVSEKPKAESELREAIARFLEPRAASHVLYSTPSAMAAGV